MGIPGQVTDGSGWPNLLSWDKDLDLDLLLGDYTDYEENYDSDDENFQKVTNTSKSKPVTSRNVFKYPVCEKEPTLFFIAISIQN